VGAADPAADIRRLESTASLFGMTPAPPPVARVLELGCGTGANLMPLAVEYPQARIVGCDTARSAIESARAMADALAVGNADFRHASITDVDEGWGEFDYILCQDVFSWVAPELQRRILDILSRNLAPQGVGYVSHDALPGWHLHEVARGMMQYHTRHLAEQRATIDQARALLSLAAEVQDQRSSTYATLIRDEYCLLSTIPDAELYHLLSEPHRSFYFHEFIDELQGATLQWITDAGPVMCESWLPESAHTLLPQSQTLERQQYIDYLVNCTFRRAMVCRNDVQISPRPDPRVLRRFCFGLSAGARVEHGVGREGTLVRTDRGELVTSDPVVREALCVLDDARPELANCSHLFPTELPVDFLIDALRCGAIDGVLTPFTVTNRIDVRPMVSPLVRLQARHGGRVTSQKSEPVRLSTLTQFFAQRLDGTRDRRELAEEVERVRESGGLEVDIALAMLTGNPDELTEESLRCIRDNALLIDSSTREA
jgi:2-polyprenyl-3-methyl-5-hydroxy-6-metoxy-1,4-benzoquinol methylase